MSFQDEVASLDAAVLTALGDAVTFIDAGGTETPGTAFVDRSVETESFAAARLPKQDYRIEISKATLPSKPTNISVRLDDGLTYGLANIEEDESGQWWIAQLRRSSGPL
ncbi:MAG: hypothetical protein AAGA36_00230 [Pseudomonadota bacterium]